jgi:hypothetical protein
MCYFKQIPPHELSSKALVTIDEVVKIPYHTTIFVTCIKCGKKYKAEDHQGYHFNYWSWFEVN